MRTGRFVLTHRHIRTPSALSASTERQSKGRVEPSGHGFTRLTSVYVQYIHMTVPGFPDDLAQCTGFQWDAGNAEKNWELHQVSQGECEQVFFNRPLLVAPDVEHSGREPRYAALGQTNAARLLVVVFTIRATLVRIISARDMSRRERRMYEQGQASG